MKPWNEDEWLPITIPGWSLNYLVNGDITGLTEDEIEMCNKFAADWEVGSEINMAEGNEPSEFFSRYPAFGEATNCEEWLCRSKKN